MGEIIIGDIVFTPRKRTLNKRGCITKIRNKESEVLSLLCSHYPEAISREEIEKKIWLGSYVTDNTLTQTISNLRHALDDKKHELVTTIPKKGYSIGIKPDFTGNDLTPNSLITDIDFVDHLKDKNIYSPSESIGFTCKVIMLITFCFFLLVSFNMTSNYYQVKIINVKKLPILVNLDEVHDKDFLFSYNKEPYVFLKKQKNGDYTICKGQNRGLVCEKK
ncbi:winged helix-turn-helix domain-containing protein [Yersinia thracica]|uniref:winged helix-turn-helix domain-containing protein n=1 Tax=Yersinia thracica TaxID=2890319 RepID=UPI00157DC1D0|nr:winged helix-turn-helix domain-containing protein [Yersinia thracica]